MKNTKEWDEMDFRDKLLYLWDRIEYYDHIKNHELKALHVFYLEQVLGVEYNV